MNLVLTGSGIDAQGACQNVLGALRSEGISVPELDMLPAARSLRWKGIEPDAALRKRVAERCATFEVDHAFMPETARLNDFGLLVFDMDSTLITIESIDEIADLCGVKDQVARITEAAMRGEIADYATSLKQRLALLAGTSEETLLRVYNERLALSPGAELLCSAARAQGLRTLVVSGGFTVFLDRLKSRLNLDFTLANQLELIDGRLTGRVLGPIVDAAAKRDMVQRTCHHLGLDPQQAIAIGDGANDLQMMAIAGMSVAYHAKPVVIGAAHHAIRFGGLDVLLEWFGTR